MKPVTRDFFKTMGMPQVAGRDFSRMRLTRRKWRSSGEALARQQYPNEDPIGKRIAVSIGRQPGPMNLEIVGVVGDIKMVTLTAQSILRSTSPTRNCRSG